MFLIIFTLRNSAVLKNDPRPILPGPRLRSTASKTARAFPLIVYAGNPRLGVVSQLNLVPIVLRRQRSRAFLGTDSNTISAVHVKHSVVYRLFCRLIDRKVRVVEV